MGWCEKPSCERDVEYCRVRNKQATYWCYAHMLEQTHRGLADGDIWLAAQEGDA